MRILWCACLFAGIAFPRAEFWAPLSPPLAHYSAEVTYDPSASRLEGQETIRFSNNTGRPIGRIQLQWLSDSLDVQVGGQSLTRTSVDQRSFLFDLPSDLGSGCEIVLNVRFAALWPLNAATGSAIASFIVPRLWWGSGTLDSYEVRLRAPEGFIWAASGRYDGHRRTYVAERARAFGAFLGKGYESFEADAGGVQVRAVFTPKGRQCAELLLATAVDAVGFYRERLGFYPHTSLSIVPGMDSPAGGYPPATALVVVHGQHRLAERPEAFWRWITAHEIGHMYWGDHVLAQGPDSLNWLMIGMGIWADQEYRRARGITTAGALQDNYVTGVLQGRDTTLDITRDQASAIRWDFNNIVEHGKSIAMLNALESVVGRPAFDTAYRRILCEYPGKRLGWRDLQAMVETESGQDLEWFFDAWVRSPANVAYRVVGRECARNAKGFECEVKVERTGEIRIPLTVAARFADGTEQRARTERLTRIDELRFHSKSPLTAVVLDPDHTLVIVDGPPLRLPLATRIQRLPWGGDGTAALELYREARQPKLDDFSDRFRLALLLFDGRRYAEALELLKDDRRFQALVWKGHMLDLLERRTEALAEYHAALQIAGDYSYRHDQWKMVLDKKWVEARLHSPFSWGR
jgi:hypothetical protein